MIDGRGSKRVGTYWSIVVNPEIKNILTELPDNLENEVFTCLAKTDNVLIERIVSLGHSSPEDGWYDQEKNDWVLVIQGSAKLDFEEEVSVTLEKGDFIAIPAHKKHRVSWTDPHVETIWLAVHY